VGRAEELEVARQEADGCRRCDLWRNATQTVFGEGTIRARAMLVGEQPGDVEDEQGRPFVGPAGALLRKVMGEVGLRERDVYLTNAVKHFKWRPKGTRRIHDTPNWAEIRACDIWLRLELATVQPELLVLLGATAAKAVLGGKARVTQLRGSVLERPEVNVPVVVTLHPSAVLRAGDQRGERRAELAEDLSIVREQLAGFSSHHGGYRRRGDQLSEKEATMPPRGVKKGTKRARQYEHIKDSLLDEGRSEDTAEEIAARTVNKERARHGEAQTSTRLSREDISSGRRGGLRAHRKSPRGRTRDQLYEEAKDKNVRGRSKMTKAQLARAVGRG
jgi:DNA polymerase